MEEEKKGKSIAPQDKKEHKSIKHENDMVKLMRQSNSRRWDWNHFFPTKSANITSKYA